MTKTNETVYKEKVARGGTIVQPLGGIDRSSYAGSAEKERGGKMNGGPNNLSHSLGTTLSGTGDGNGRTKSKFD